MKQAHGRPSYFISAGEFSGDLLAADLAKQLQFLLPEYEAFGLVGNVMRRAGVREVCSMDDLSVMGVVDVARKLPELKRAESYLLSKIDEEKPRFAVLVDYPGLHFRIAEQLKIRGIPVFQYVAPKLWAWGEYRMPMLRDNFTKILGVLPFERNFFVSQKVPYSFVGSPQLDRIEKIHISRKSLGLKDHHPIISILPGSRPSELSLMLPRLLQIKASLEKVHANIQFLLPLAKSLSLENLETAAGKTICRVQENGGGETLKLEGIRILQGLSLEAMSVSDAAIVTSGTATLECGLLGIPMTVVYMMDETSFAIAKSRVKVKFASLVNLIMEGEIVREFIQDFRDLDVVDCVSKLLGDTPERRQMLDALARLKKLLPRGAAERAAAAINASLPK